MSWSSSMALLASLAVRNSTTLFHLCFPRSNTHTRTSTKPRLPGNKHQNHTPQTPYPQPCEHSPVSTPPQPWQTPANRRRRRALPWISLPPRTSHPPSPHPRHSSCGPSALARWCPRTSCPRRRGCAGLQGRISCLYVERTCFACVAR